MRIIPAIDLLDGKCVRLVSGDPHKLNIVLDNPVGIARDFEKKGAKYLHVIDLDKAFDRPGNNELIKQIVSELKIPVQVGGGLRTDDAIKEVLDMGVARAIVGTRGITDVEWLKAITAKFPGRIVLAVDAKGEEIRIKGWQEGSGKMLFPYSKEVDGFGLGAFLFTNIEVEGQLKGIDINLVRRFVPTIRTPVIVAGGITTMKDLELLNECGVHAAVIGSAIYEKSIDLVEAFRLFDRDEPKKEG